MNVRLTLADARGRAGVADVELLELTLGGSGRVGHGVGGGEERERHERDEEERDAGVHGDGVWLSGGVEVNGRAEASSG